MTCRRGLARVGIYFRFFLYVHVDLHVLYSIQLPEMALQIDVKCFLVVVVLAGLVGLLNGRLDSLIRLILSLIFYGIVGALVYNFVILRLLSKFIRMRRQRNNERQQNVPVSVSEVMERRELAREKQQSRVRMDASEYAERVLRPKDEARRKRQQRNIKFAVKMFPEGGETLGEGQCRFQEERSGWMDSGCMRLTLPTAHC